MKRRLILGSFLIFLVGMISCQKDNRGYSSSSLATNMYTSVAEIVGNQVNAVTTASEHCFSMQNYDGHNGDFVIAGNPAGFGRMPGWGFPGVGPLKFGVPRVDSCATVTVSSNTYPKIITIEYLKDCSRHMHEQSGKVIITLSDTITNAGAIQTITYQDFYIDSMKVDLDASVKNMGKNSQGNWVIEKKYKQTITRGDEVCVRENSESAEWTAGFETADKSDNIYYLSGNGSVVVNDTARYTKTITTPLLFDASCEFIKSGIIELNRKGNVTTIDYGDGTCDDKATVTSNGTTEEINLHANKFKEGGHNHGKPFKGFGDHHGR